MTELLVAVSEDTPVLLVLEDLHWADASTLLLVRHLVRSGAAARMLVVATFRDTEADAAGLSDALVDVYRTEVVRIRLGGLADAELAEFIRLAAGVEPTAELTEVVRELTGGNVPRHRALARARRRGRRRRRPHRRPARAPCGRARDTGHGPRGGEPAASAALREAIELLELAAVVGADFELATLRRAGVLAEAPLLDAIDEAVRAGLLVELPGTGLAYRFTHELVRRAVVGRLSASRAAELHLRVARVGAERGAPRAHRRSRRSRTTTQRQRRSATSRAPSR